MLITYKVESKKEEKRDLSEEGKKDDGRREWKRIFRVGAERCVYFGRRAGAPMFKKNAVKRDHS